jgi:colicin import membrane protein
VIHPSGQQRLGAGALAILMHGLFFLALVFSVSWQSLPQSPVYADLWTELPALPLPPPLLEPEPVEAPEAPPEPVPPPPPPAPVAEPRPAPPPDIALKAREEAERRREEAREQARQEAEARKAAEEAQRQEAERQALARQREEEQRRAEEARRVAREQARRELEEDMARQMREELAAESGRMRAQQAADARAVARARQISEYQDRIRGKIRGHLRLPVKLTGNPEAVFQVQLLPDGEVLRVTLLQSSGQPAYDLEVERAILKASPLPLPPDREAAAAFRDALVLKFRPREEGAAGP